MYCIVNNVSSMLLMLYREATINKDLPLFLSRLRKQKKLQKYKNSRSPHLQQMLPKKRPQLQVIVLKILRI